MRTDDIPMTHIGTIRSTRAQAEDDHWDAERSFIELDAAQFTADALAGLDAISHVEVVYVFDRVDPQRVESGARHPRTTPRGPRSASSPSARRTGRTGSARPSAASIA